jgi:hypothetical protein
VTAGPNGCASDKHVKRYGVCPEFPFVLYVIAASNISFSIAEKTTSNFRSWIITAG